MPLNQFLIIKPNILQDKDLSSTDKLILAFISGFWQSGAPFYASNREISKFLGISIRQVIRSIQKMADYGYIVVKHSKDDHIPGNDIRIIEKSIKYEKLFTDIESILLGHKKIK